ncbi:MAG: ABC-F family ATP-binding cassette domain-containing protein [Angelakisella sp.]
MLISLQDLAKSFGSDLIFSGVTAKIEDNDRIGLVGANGAGKTTLLNIIVGLSEPDAGELSRGNNLSIGYQRQNSGLCQTSTIIEEMRSVFADVYQLEQELQQVRVAMSTAPEASQQALGEQYHALEDCFLARDGYQVEVKISTVLTGMGFAEHGRDKTIDKLSGGEQTRLAIAKLLLEQPSLLILDEPTNHLDFKTLGWLEDYLSGYRGALLIVSHDRYFLDRLCTRIWEMERGELSVFSGNYSRYMELREERDAHQQKLYDQQQEEIAKLSDYVARNLVRASTTKMAQSRRRQLEKMEVQDRPKARLKPPVIRLEYAAEPVKDLLTVEQLVVAVGEGNDRRTLLSGLDLSVARGDRVAIIGGNGTGKTSLLRALLDGETKVAGRVDWGRGVKHSFYTQGSENLEESLTVLDTMWQYYPRSYETTLRSMLGALGLSGEDAFKRVGQLSGGERARLKLAIICLSGSNTLILDEPTNHLDLATKEVLEQALCSFTGTIIMVSHDRYLLDRLPTRIIELENGVATQYKGRYRDYLAQKSPTQKQPPQKAAEVQAASVTEPDEGDGQRSYRKGKETRREEAQRRKDYADTEARINELEERLARLEFQLTEPETMADYLQLQELLAEQQLLQQELSQAMTHWVELAE